MSVKQLLERIVNSDALQTDEPQTPPPEIIGFFVRWVRGLKQWKQSTLAGFAGVSLSTVERVERGERVSDECLDRIGIALGFECGYLTAPRRPLSPEEAAADFVEKYGEMEPVSVCPLRTQNQVREIAKCGAFLIHRPELGEAYDEMIAELVEWIDLASFLICPVIERTVAEEGGRRELYKDILACVQRLEESGVTVLSGIMDAPQEGIPDWKVALVSLTPKASDPGARKRRSILVDRRCVALSKVRGPSEATAS